MSDFDAWWKKQPVPAEFDSMDAFDQKRWKDLVRSAFERQQESTEAPQVGHMTDAQIDACWDGLMPSGCGKSRYDIARAIVRAALASSTAAPDGKKP